MEVKNAVPYSGKSIFGDMVSNEIFPRGRASASRLYIEMILDLFLCDELKNELREEKFYKLSLGERIQAISNTTSQEIIDTLYRIKNYGDKASHYNPNVKITEEQSDKIAKDALGIFELILVEYFKKNKFDKTYNTSVIFSTLFPEIRANVLGRFINKVYIRKQYDREVFRKYILALVKANKSNKAKRILDDFKKRGVIDYASYIDGKEIIKNIGSGMKNKELPIPTTIQDCKRNFQEVMKQISDTDKEENRGLITIISRLLDEYNSSDMGDFIPNKVYHSEFLMD